MATKTKTARLSPEEMALIKTLRVCGIEPSEMIVRTKEDSLITIYQTTLKQLKEEK